MTREQTITHINALLKKRDDECEPLLEQIDAIEGRYTSKMLAAVDEWAKEAAAYQRGQKVRMRLTAMSGKKVTRFGEIIGIRSYINHWGKPKNRIGFDYHVHLYDGNGIPWTKEFVAPRWVKPLK